MVSKDDRPTHLLETPLGMLRVFVRLNGAVMDSHDSDAASFRVVPQEWSVGDVAGAQGVVLQCSTRKKIRQLTFECRWDDGAAAGRGRPECDTGVNALRWSGDGHTVLVGTEDSGAIQKRASRGHNMTSGLGRCFEEITPELEHLVFWPKEDGFITRLTDIPAKEMFQLHYAVTWNAHPEPTSEATWLALSGLLSHLDGYVLPSKD